MGQCSHRTATMYPVAVEVRTNHQDAFVFVFVIVFVFELVSVSAIDFASVLVFVIVFIFEHFEVQHPYQVLLKLYDC